MTWEEWSKQERVWDFRRGENPDPDMIRVANAYTIGELTKEQMAQEISKKRARETGTQPRKSRKKRKTKKEKKREEEDVLNVTEEMIAETQSRIEEIEGRIHNQRETIPAYFGKGSNGLDFLRRKRRKSRKKKGGRRLTSSKRRRKSKKKVKVRRDDTEDDENQCIRIRKPRFIECPYPECARKCEGLEELQRHLQVHKSERQEGKRRRWAAARLASHVIASPRKPRRTTVDASDEEDGDEEEEEEDEEEEEEDGSGEITPVRVHEAEDGDESEAGEMLRVLCLRGVHRSVVVRSGVVESDREF